MVFFLIALLRYNSHTRKFTHLKCTFQRFLVYSQSSETSTAVDFRTFSLFSPQAEEHLWSPLFNSSFSSQPHGFYSPGSGHSPKVTFSERPSLTTQLTPVTPPLQHTHHASPATPHPYPMHTLSFSPDTDHI